MTALRWLKDYWMIPLIFIGGIFVVLWCRARGRPTKGIMDRVQIELDAIAAQREAREMQAQLGLDEARQHVLDKYREKRQLLSEEENALVKSLEENPEELARILEKLTR